MDKIVIDIIGWAGAVNVLAAYFMVSFGKTKGTSNLYQALNIIGALCLIINTAYYQAYPSTVVNIIWILIAVYSLGVARLARKREKSNISS